MRTFRFFIPAFGAILWLGGCGVKSEADKYPEDSLEWVIEKHIEARGGRAVFEKMNSYEYVVQTHEFGSIQPTSTVSTTRTRDGKFIRSSDYKLDDERSISISVRSDGIVRWSKILDFEEEEQSIEDILFEVDSTYVAGDFKKEYALNLFFPTEYTAYKEDYDYTPPIQKGQDYVLRFTETPSPDSTLFNTIVINPGTFEIESIKYEYSAPDDSDTTFFTPTKREVVDGILFYSEYMTVSTHGSSSDGDHFDRSTSSFHTATVTVNPDIEDDVFDRPDYLDFSENGE